MQRQSLSVSAMCISIGVRGFCERHIVSWAHVEWVLLTIPVRRDSARPGPAQAQLAVSTPAFTEGILPLAQGLSGASPGPNEFP